MEVNFSAFLKSDSDAQSYDSPLTAFLDESHPAYVFQLWLEVCGEIPANVSAKDLLNLQIAEIDELINEQLNEIMHHPRFQKMEARWLGLWRLVDESSHSRSIKIKLLDASWRDLSRDAERAADFERTRLFHLIYNDEFGIAGGEPFGVLLGDYEVSHTPNGHTGTDDIFTLQVIASAAAAAFAPFICSATPSLFGVDSFDELNTQVSFDSIFQHPQYNRWNNLRASEDSRFLGITVPPVLMREPLNTRFSSYQNFRFREDCEYKTSEKYLWGSGSFAFGSVLIREYAEVGWFAHIRGTPRDLFGGGLVTSFATPLFGIDSSPCRPKGATPTILTESMERQLSELGFMTLSQGYGSPYASFTNCPSIQRPKNYNNKAANANARISSMLQHILCASRFAQYIKMIIRDKIGSLSTADGCQRELQTWLNKYTSGRDDLDWEMLALKPLRQAQVQISERPGQLGCYQCTIFLKNHYTVDHLVAELKLSTAINNNALGSS